MSSCDWKDLEALVKHNDLDDPTLAPAGGIDHACPSRVADYLYLGSLIDALDTSKLKSLDINAVMNVAKETHCFSDNLYDSDVELTRFPLVDSADFAIRNHVEPCLNAIDKARASGRVILVHCQAGVSRAATIVIAYLVTREKMTPAEAIRHVLKSRPIIRPNEGFLHFLAEL